MPWQSVNKKIFYLLKKRKSLQTMFVSLIYRFSEYFILPEPGAPPWLQSDLMSPQDQDIH